jgi:SAM-dependent methyltransferase
MTSFVKRFFRKFLTVKGALFIQTRREWEQQYIDGQWNCLREINELGHYFLVAGYFSYFKPRGSLLDVGCGEAILLERLGSQGYSLYVGIDISHFALVKAKLKADEKTLFIEGDFGHFIPKVQVDAVIFCETLYCFSHPLEVMKEYEAAMKNDGIFIVSMHDGDCRLPLWKEIDQAYTVLAEAKVAAASESWMVKVYTPVHDRVNNSRLT